MSASSTFCMPELSVIVPSYQRPERLAQALASARQAFSGALELIVVDDCPEGSGFAAAREAGARYLAKAGIERGLSESRNLGLALARGRCVSFLDDDDRFEPGALDALTAQAAASGALCFGDAVFFNAQQQQRIDLSGVTLQTLLVCNRIPVGAYVLPRAAALQHRFDRQLRSHEDWEFLLALASRCGLRHVPGSTPVVWIDKTETEGQASMQQRRRSLFWLDFLSIYARFPAPELAPLRAQMLGRLGVQINAEMLAHADQI